MGKGVYYREGKDIRRKSSSHIYARFTNDRVDVESLTTLIDLLNGAVQKPSYHFVVVGKHDSKTVVCKNVETGEEVLGLGFRGDNGTRVKAMLERLAQVTAPSFIDKILEEEI